MSGRGGRVGLQERLGALDAALTAAHGRVPTELVAEAQAVRRRADERRARGDQTVVVALCGGTGTGKSSLFNALAGADLTAVDVRRPTTSAATAWSVGEVGETAAVLDWLDVEAARRHHCAPGRGPDGLVLVDLPDIDSVATANRVTADRLIERVDVLVWVVDALKYAQRSLHEGYLSRLREHADVMLVVLNKVDQLDAGARRECQRDLERLVADDGRAPRVLAVSTATGEGVDHLRKLLAGEVRERRAVAERIAADVRSAAGDLLAHLDPPAASATGSTLDPERITGLLAALADVDTFADQAAAAYAAAARRALRTPLLAVMAAAAGLLRAIAGGAGRLRRLVLADRPGHATPAAGPDPGTAGLDVRHALLELVEHARRSLPWFWAERLRDIADLAGAALPTALKAALARVVAAPPRRRWWTAVAAVWWAAELLAAAGVAWLLLARLTASLQMPRLPVPAAGADTTVPGIMIAAGAAVWITAAVARAVSVRAGARRHRRDVDRHARSAVRQAVTDTALEPLHDELGAYQRTRDALARAAA